MKTPIWPYIAVVACLFVLSLLAPQAWMRPALPPAPTFEVEPESMVDFAVIPEATSEEAFSGNPVLNASEGHALAAQPVDPFPDVPLIFQAATPAQVAPIHPPVGEQIKLDISVQETPALPSGSATAGTAVDSRGQSPEPAIPDVSLPLQKQGFEMLPEVANTIPYPPSLIDGLRDLASEPLCREWALDIIAALQAIHRTEALAAPEMQQHFQLLFRRLGETPGLVGRAQSLQTRTDLLRLGYAAKRRADIWHQVHRILSQEQVSVSLNSAGMKQRVQDVSDRLSGAEYAAEWRRYLLLDEVRSMIGPGDRAERRELAKKILKRLESPQMSEQQAEILEKSPFAEFALELRRWSSEPVDYLKLLDQIEDYELTSNTVSARAIAHCYDVIRWSPESEPRKLAELLNTHYRNANVRVALTAEFLNRLLPEPQSFEENVSGSIAGANVFGTSHTVNRLRVVLHPDQETWHIGLEAHGEVASDTAASKGPATFYNQGFARYHARKSLMVDRRGIRVWRAETNADSETALTGFETDFDPIPIVGWLARSVARSQHEQHYHSAKAETEEMVRNQAGTRFDNEVHSRLEVAERKVQQKLIGPFEKIALKPTALDMRTTEQRVIARYRLAADDQLGAQTPRPQAPGDSLLSVQIHESALNNTLANLQLEGRRTELQQLYRDLADTFERPELEVPEDFPEGIIVQFADQDAVRVRCDDSKVTLTIRLAELKSGRSKWNDFTVRAFYVPDSNQLNANLVRDGEVHIIGDLLKLPLRVIFSKVLSKSRPFNLINKRLIDNPHLSDCRVNQFVINDGWIGVGIGPERAGELDEFARQPAADEVEQR